MRSVWVLNSSMGNGAILARSFIAREEPEFMLATTSNVRAMIRSSMIDGYVKYERLDNHREKVSVYPTKPEVTAK
jgi:hypothetical protein